MSDGYFFVPLPGKVRRAFRDAAVHDRRVEGTLSGAIEIALRAEQPIHIGSGFKGFDGEVVVRRGVRVRGAPGIPGASVKGALRARYEAITASCSGRPKTEQHNVRSSSYPIKHARLAPEVTRADVFNECRDEEMCAACAVFGRMSKRSRITVTDFVTEGDVAFGILEMPEAFSPNYHHLGAFRIATGPTGRQHFEITKLHGRKFAAGRGPVAPKARWQRVEVIPKRTLIRGVLRVFNLRPDELGGLLAALGRLPASVIKLGGGKGQGFGRVRLETIAYRLQDFMGRPAPPDEAAWRGEFERCADRWASGEADLVRIHQGDC